MFESPPFNLCLDGLVGQFILGCCHVQLQIFIFWRIQKIHIIYCPFLPDAEKIAEIKEQKIGPQVTVKIELLKNAIEKGIL